MDDRSNMTLMEMIPANDPRMKNTFDYSKKENRFYLLPLKLEFNKKDYGFIGAIPKKTCNLVMADEISRRLSGILELIILSRMRMQLKKN